MHGGPLRSTSHQSSAMIAMILHPERRPLIGISLFGMLIRDNGLSVAIPSRWRHNHRLLSPTIQWHLPLTTYYLLILPLLLSHVHRHDNGRRPPICCLCRQPMHKTPQSGERGRILLPTSASSLSSSSFVIVVVCHSCRLSNIIISSWYYYYYLTMTETARPPAGPTALHCNTLTGLWTTPGMIHINEAQWWVGLVLGLLPNSSPNMGVPMVYNNNTFLIRGVAHQ